MPGDNPAAIDIKDSGGFVADPNDVGAKSATAWLSELAADRELVEQIGHRTRAIAEQKFDVDGVARQFDAILTDAVTAQRT
jgi:glycosyltransferase involved in cell wall biosynthesis